MDLTGIIKLIRETQQVSEKFKKREVVITDNSSQYPQHIQFQLPQDKVALIDAYKVGDEIKAHFNLRGKEYTKDDKTSYFNSLEIWRIEGVGAATSTTTTTAAPAATTTKTEQPVAEPANQEDDLPF